MNRRQVLQAGMTAGVPLLRGLAPALPLLGLAGCISVGTGSKLPPHAQFRLTDAGADKVVRLAKPLVGGLVVQALPSDALADTLSIAYSRQANQFAYYQLASWTERPVRLVPRLLQNRLDARGVASAVGQAGDAVRADWLLTVAVDTLHHDVTAPPGVARLALSLELFDRRQRRRLDRRQFVAAVPTAVANSQLMASAASLAVAQVFDQAIPWVEGLLQQTGNPA